MTALDRALAEQRASRARRCAQVVAEKGDALQFKGQSAAGHRSTVSAAQQPRGATEPSADGCSDIPALLRAAAAILATAGHVILPDRGGRRIDTASFAAWLEEIATQREELDRPDLHIIGEAAALALARAVLGGGQS